jgi:hypothetical protein
MCRETNTPTDTCKRTENQTVTAGSVYYKNIPAYRVCISASVQSRLLLVTLAQDSIKVAACYTSTGLDQSYCFLH